MYKRRTPTERKRDQEIIFDFLRKKPHATISEISEELSIPKSKVKTTLKDIENSKSERTLKEDNFSISEGYLIDTSICNYDNIIEVLKEISLKYPVILTTMVIRELKFLSLKFTTKDGKAAKNILSLCATDVIAHKCFEIDESFSCPDQNLLNFAKFHNFTLITSDNEMTLLARCYGIRVINTFSYKFIELIEKNKNTPALPLLVNNLTTVPVANIPEKNIPEKNVTEKIVAEKIVSKKIIPKNNKEQQKLISIPYVKPSKDGFLISGLSTKTQFFIKGRSAKKQILPTKLKVGETVFFLTKQKNDNFLLQEYLIVNNNKTDNSYCVQQFLIYENSLFLKDYLIRENLI